MTKDVWPLLRKRFPADQYALMQEVRNAAGHGASRSADGIAMGLWPSRGLEVAGIEVKISRGDWLREMKQPQKAEAIFKYCDRWWLVTSDDTIAKKEEIPVTWGWLAVKGERMMVMVDAPKLTPEPLTRGFVACMMKRAFDGMIHPSSMKDHIDAVKEQAIKSALASQQRFKLDYENLKASVDAFEQASGIHITTYHGVETNKKMGEALRVIMSGGTKGIENQLRSLKHTVDSIHASVTEKLASIENL